MTSHFWRIASGSQLPSSLPSLPMAEEVSKDVDGMNYNDRVLFSQRIDAKGIGTSEDVNAASHYPVCELYKLREDLKMMEGSMNSSLKELERLVNKS